MGGSTGINVAGAIRMAKDLGPGHTIVTILCDYGTRYQSKLFNPEFLRSKGSARAALAGGTRAPPSKLPYREMKPFSPCLDRMARRASRRARYSRGRCIVVSAAGRPRRAEPNTRPRIFPRAVFFDIDDLSDEEHRPAAHAGARAEIRQPHAQAGPRRRQSDRRL